MWVRGLLSTEKSIARQQWNSISDVWIMLEWRKIGENFLTPENTFSQVVANEKFPRQRKDKII